MQTIDAYVHGERRDSCVVTTLLSFCDGSFKPGNKVTFVDRKIIENQKAAVPYLLPRAAVKNPRQHNKVMLKDGIVDVFISITGRFSLIIKF